MNQVYESRVSCLPNVRPDLNRTRHRRGVFATPAWPPLILPFGFPLVSFRHFLRVADQNKPGTGDEVMRLAADRDAWLWESRTVQRFGGVWRRLGKWITKTQALGRPNYPRILQTGGPCISESKWHPSNSFVRPRLLNWIHVNGLMCSSHCKTAVGSRRDRPCGK